MYRMGKSDFSKWLNTKINTEKESNQKKEIDKTRKVT
jgi:hypothetical protein